MKIRHWWNSFFEISLSHGTLVCDPWVNEVAEGYGWKPNKSFDLTNVNALLSSARYIYISHIHYDHCDIALLSEAIRARISEATIIIPKLHNKHLRKKLSSICTSAIEILELEPYQQFSLTENEEVTIVPQLSGFADGSRGIEYDLDSSLVVHDRETGATFFNSVDNPLSPSDYAEAMTKLPYKKVTVLSLPCTSASEYPQSYLGINRLQEQKRIKNILAKKTVDILAVVKPAFFVKAGGAYAICDQYSELEKYKVELSHGELLDISMHLDETEYLPISTMECIELCGNMCKLRSENLDFRGGGIGEKRTTNQKADFNITEIDKIFDLAVSNFERAIERNLLSPKQPSKISYKFCLYPLLPRIDSSAAYLRIIDKPSHYLGISVEHGHSSSQTDGGVDKLMTLHMTGEIFVKCLNRTVSWNTALTSSAILVERVPNVFDPLDQQLLNFLVSS